LQTADLLRSGKVNSVQSWVATSELPKREWLENPLGEYAARAVIQEWPREDYISEEGSSEVFIYFVYLPPNVEVDLRKVTRSGFSFH